MEDTCYERDGARYRRVWFAAEVSFEQSIAAGLYDKARRSPTHPAQVSAAWVAEEARHMYAVEYAGADI